MASGEESEAPSALLKQGTRTGHDLSLLKSEPKQGKPRQARASKPKVRTGCTTWYVSVDGLSFLSLFLERYIISQTPILCQNLLFSKSLDTNSLFSKYVNTF